MMQQRRLVEDSVEDSNEDGDEDSNENANEDANEDTNDDAPVAHTTQLNLPLVFLPPIGRELHSICFHSPDAFTFVCV
ncbi:hypothetical protein CABS01_11749 [Colletotrichum abscissum]|uniref:Uncharacterized protein n=1 Tax=Colletotrichum abscissum TaxID=1671311 RepID=A0A9P9XCM3_9PEZI|nr:uncharacterized protein CABS01_11749 [Colletotrichum abscissum]KAI3548669.1 hypothetical protein CABS02_08199 [Colletotrichum abscissum]KAK1492852.1 hypothetical protein CABS01_11749 [Colletotrichum abscissum]